MERNSHSEQRLRNLYLSVKTENHKVKPQLTNQQTSPSPETDKKKKKKESPKEYTEPLFTLIVPQAIQTVHSFLL